MNTIMTIAHNANNIAAIGQASEVETAAHEPNVRLLYEIDNTELHLLEDVQQRLQVVHPAHENIHHFAEEIINAQKKVEEACRLYENRINKRPPGDIA